MGHFSHCQIFFPPGLHQKKKYQRPGESHNICELAHSLLRTSPFLATFLRTFIQANVTIWILTYLYRVPFPHMYLFPVSSRLFKLLKEYSCLQNEQSIEF